MRRRLAVSLLIGLFGATICYGHFVGNHLLGTAADLQWPLQGARMLVAGQNPYGPAFAVPEVPYFTSNPDPLLYPLPALLLLIPALPFPPTIVALVFVGVSALLAAYALSAKGWEWLLVFISAPFVFACAWAQWSPLILFAGLAPAAAPLALCKPSLGAAMLAYRPSRRAILWCAVVGLVTLLIWPAWPWEWRANLSGQQYQIPLLQPGGFLLLLAVFRWRRPEGRLLLVMACIPQNLWFYDQLPLALIPQSRRARLLWIICSHLAVLGFTVLHQAGYAVKVGDFVMGLLYLPSLGCLFWPQPRHAAPPDRGIEEQSIVPPSLDTSAGSNSADSMAKHISRPLYSHSYIRCMLAER